MVDPLTAFAAIKGGIAAGKQLHSMTKDIAAFFDSVDGAKANHTKKKSSIFASANEEALDTFMKQQQAKDAEEQLKELITNTRGYTAYQELLSLRREIRLERKEAARLALIEAEERREVILSIILIVSFLLVVLASGVAYLWYLGWIDLGDIKWQ
tara:strand:+ start:418 stop:882 length:465 start_codon:yes stop_codon:yes gene_type:complete